METVRPAPTTLQPGTPVCWFSRDSQEGGQRVRHGVYLGMSEQFPWWAEIRVKKPKPDDTERVYMEPRNLFLPGVAQASFDFTSEAVNA